MSKHYTVTVEQLAAAFTAWDNRATEDPSHFDEWAEADAADGNLTTAEWFAERLVEAGAQVAEEGES